jgi:membrane protein
MDETKNKYILYFINVFISGLVYSFMTSKLLSLGVHNSLIIIFIASVVDLVITYDTKKSHHFEQISPYIYSLISLLVFLLICLINSTSQWFYLIVYSYLSFFFSIVTLFLQTEILDYEQNVKLGFLNMQFMRSASKMIGFLLGILLEILSNDIYFLSILFLCFLANTIGLKNLNWSSHKKIEKKVQLLIKEKKLIFF